MSIAPIIPPSLEEQWDEVAHLRRQLTDSLRVIAILVKRLGGEVEIDKFEEISTNTEIHSWQVVDRPATVIKVVTPNGKS